MRKRTKRKVWDLVDTINFVIQGVQVSDDKILDEVRMIELSAMDSFKRGMATKEDWFTIVAMLNVAETTGKSGIGPEILPWCERLQKALIESKERFERIGKFGFDGAGLNAMREVYEYHDLQRQSISRKEYERQILKCRNKMISKSKDLTVI